MNRQRLRIRFRKEGDLRLISHRDLARALERLFRRAELPLAMSEGFHPHPRMTFPHALALGIEGANEVVEVMLEDVRNVEHVRQRLIEDSPPGLEITSVTELEPNERKARAESVTYEITVPPQRQEALRSAMNRLLAQQTCLLYREGRTQPIELRSCVKDLQLHDGRLQIHLWVTQQASARPREVLAELGVDDLERDGNWMTRTQVHLTS
jgi:radical SAM-linked protein